MQGREFHGTIQSGLSLWAMNPGHDSACSIHMAVGHIRPHHRAVSGHVCSDESRGSSTLSPCLLRLRIRCAAALIWTDRSDWLLLSMSSPTRLRSCHHPVPPPPTREHWSHLRGRGTLTSERAGGAAPMLGGATGRRGCCRSGRNQRK